MTTTTTAIVIDNGSYMCRAGLAGEDAPRSELPTVLGQPKSLNKYPILEKSRMIGKGMKDPYFGYGALENRDTLNLSYDTINRGLITNFDEMQFIWESILYQELRINSAEEQHPIILSESPINPTINRERTTEIMFESLGIPSLYMAPAQLLSLYATSRDTGIVLDSGHQISHAVPIYKGQVINHAISTLELGGIDITKELAKLINQQANSNYQFNTSKQLDQIVRDMKEKHGDVATFNDNNNKNNNNNNNNSQSIGYKLPDSNVIVPLTSERFKCTEPLFQPSLLGINGGGLHQLVYDSIHKCNSIEQRSTLLDNIVLSGGNSLFGGIAIRMQKELTALLPSGAKSITIIPPPNQQYNYGTWIGGSILGSISSFDDIKISRKEYDEHGKSIHSKCNSSSASTSRICIVTVYMYCNNELLCLSAYLFAFNLKSFNFAFAYLSYTS
ncbi:hypothetical protein DFA_07273 [Cavenderia fasciculata]|uniref:Actin n=1 Tax=Cavenderia fasciculata TaxID=261658 RepID=F4PVY9_CACFS|nr:uncharacterized protein DFA_07273 [Cavenderia fasciculata]EGG20153.1 hypothetical protein DFA_07273 [Cavenderia fasciculata]|eukprot:XP_004367136.1 hypothetical protein DFA_07273 [Cavenderia fasciculata]